MAEFNIGGHAYYICSKDADMPVHGATVTDVFEDDGCVELFDGVLGFVTVEEEHVFPTREAAVEALAGN